MNDKLEMKGEVFLNFRDAENNIIATEHVNNLVVSLGRQEISLFLGAGNMNNIASIGFGESNTPAQMLDTSLTNQFTKVLDGVQYSGNAVEFLFSLDLTEANGMNIWELGLFHADGKMFSRVVRGAVAQKTAAVRIDGFWKISP